MQLKKMIVVTDLVLKLYGLIPAAVFHNLGKSKALKLAFWHLAIDAVEGAYVEFGVASGNSMRSAEIAERRSHSRSLGISHVERKLYGFDTFESFSSDTVQDEHPTWQGENFSVGLSRVSRRFRKHKNRINLFALDASTLVKDNEKKVDINKFIPDESIAIALLDMDLGSPTLQALEWMKPKLKSGSVVIFDEFFAYRGAPNLGESGAWESFLQNNPKIKGREYIRYGDGGVGFQLTISD